MDRQKGGGTMGFICGSIALLMLLGFLGFVGSLISGGRTGETLPGFLLGFFLGPIGWLICFALPRSEPAQRPRAARSTWAATPGQSGSDAGEKYCVKCGRDAIESIELGTSVWTCPQCGRRL